MDDQTVTSENDAMLADTPTEMEFEALYDDNNIHYDIDTRDHDERNETFIGTADTNNDSPSHEEEDF